MLITRFVNKIRLLKTCNCASLQLINGRNYCKSSKKDDGDATDDSNLKLGNMASKYKVFKDEDAEIILDVYEERLKYSNLIETEGTNVPDPFEGINLKRGLSGVFDIADLVDVLKLENAQDIFVASVPLDIKYVDYMVVVTAKSFRHMQAMAQFIRRVFKQKMHKTDILPKLEGEHSKDWMALDLGNIALHVFSYEARTRYDLDMLWSVGPKFDKEYNKQDPIAHMLEQHSSYLHDLQPAT